MRIEDKFQVGETYSGPVMADINYNPPCVDYFKLDELFSHLVEGGVVLDKRNSEREIEYKVRSLGKVKEKKKLVPYMSEHEDSGVNTVGAILRSEDLKITIKNYRTKRGNDLDGGDVNLESGVRGSIVFEGSYVSGEIVKKAVGLVERFYREGQNRNVDYEREGA